MEKLGLEGLTGRFVGATAEYIADLERQCGFQVPHEYREFLQKYGCSLFVEDCVYRPASATPWSVNGVQSIDLFYGMAEKPEFDLLRSNVRLLGDIPATTIVIGYDSGSSHILLDSCGAVYFLDGETGKMYLCAKEFGEFLNSFEIRH
jgi:hypothetical protein